MKKIVRFFLIILFAVFVFLLSSCKKYNYKEHLIVSGDFKYLKIKNKNNNEYEVHIIELSEEGLRKECIVIPNIIDEMKVVGLGLNEKKYFKTKEQPHYFYVSNIKSLYIPDSVYFYDNRISLLNYNASLKIKLFIPHFYEINVEEKDCANPYENIIFFCHNPKENTIFDDEIICYSANVSYYVDDSVYFVDDCDGTIVNVIPPEPVKDNYYFDGWYKDELFTEKWDFNFDIVPLKKYDAQMNYIYQETRLFAKFTYIGD